MPPLPRVELLDLSSNLIQTILWHWFKAPCLEDLDLTNNRIVHVSGSFHADAMPSIIFISLSRNRISTFRKESFLFPTCLPAEVSIDENPARCDPHLCWLHDELQCLSQCVQTCGKPEDLVPHAPASAFRDCCPECPYSALYLQLLQAMDSPEEHNTFRCASPKHVEGRQVTEVLTVLCGSTTVQNSLVSEPERQTLAYRQLTSTQGTSARYSAFPTNSTLYGSVSTIRQREKKVQTSRGKQFFVAALVILSLTVLFRLFLSARQRCNQRGHAIIMRHQALGIGTSPQQLGLDENAPSENCERIQPYHETSLANITLANQGCESQRPMENSYSCIKDDLNCVGQIVEARREHQYCNEVSRYQAIPNKLGCTGVEPYAETSLANIAVEAAKDQHNREDDADCNEVSRYQAIPNELGCTGVEPYAETSLANIAVEAAKDQHDDPDCHEMEAEPSETTRHSASGVSVAFDVTSCSQTTLGQMHTFKIQNSNQRETDVGETATPVLNTNSGETTYTPMSAEAAPNATSENIQTDNKVFSASNEMVYRHSTHCQESTLSENIQADNKVFSASNEMVYRHSTHFQESTPSNTRLLTRTEVVSTSSETVYRNDRQSLESRRTASDAALFGLSEINLQDSKDTENCTYNPT
ncbi:Transcriptional adapter 1 [Branchiostoma belcheri]|nr:Transcriptional adapter 1 [Branchiostoma belcheri]